MNLSLCCGDYRITNNASFMLYLSFRFVPSLSEFFKGDCAVSF